LRVVNFQHTADDAHSHSAVKIHEEAEAIDPSASRNSKIGESPTIPPQSSRLHRASISGKKLSGRPSVNRDVSFNSQGQQISSCTLDGPENEAEAELKTEDSAALLSQVAKWLREERAKRAKKGESESASGPGVVRGLDGDEITPESGLKQDQDSLALDKLEGILAGFVVSASGIVATAGHKIPQASRRRSSVGKKLKRGLTAASSDTEYLDGDLLVPNVEAVLDNSKTMTNPAALSDNDLTTVKSKDKEEWASFKSEIVRLARTLKLKGWRRIPIERGADVDVERLSGALTNAVYVVSPPKDLPDPPKPSDGSLRVASRRKPMKLLLRIYGPQVEHLIDREGELAILRRLARKRIGPRLLGTFSNGRFEEYLHARPLSPEDLRVPETSKQIAKRMRELHDGIELLEGEREGGPFVWRNWDKWFGRCEQVITWLDKQILATQRGKSSSIPQKRWMKRGFVCGVEWSLFRKTVEKYRKELEKTHGGKSGIREQLVFAHNDVRSLHSPSPSFS